MNNQYDYIYKIQWFESARRTISHTDMYFKNVEHTYWVFEANKHDNDTVRVQLICVDRNSREYESAINNSNKNNKNN